MSHEIEKVNDSRDQDRCQSSAGLNQCMNRSVVGTSHCKAHGGASIAARNERAAIHKFRKTKWYDAIKDEYDQSSVKSLHGEVAVLKMLLTNLVGRIQTESDLMIQTGSISDLVVKIDKVVTSCHKLDKEQSMLVDQATVMQFAMSVSEVIMQELDGPEDKEKLSNISIAIGQAFMSIIQSNGEMQDDE